MTSIRQGLTLLGITEVKKWMTLMTLSNMARDKPEELAVNATVRAKFCELLASKVGLANRRTDLYLMGLFSQVDAFIDQPRTAILAELPLPDDVRQALSGGSGPLRDVSDLVQAYERRRWDGFSRCAAKLGIGEPEIPQIYRESSRWAHAIFNA